MRLCAFNSGFIFAAVFRMIKRTLWFFVFALMAISCLDQPDCFSLNNNIIGVTFKKLSDNRADTIALEGIDSPDAGITYQTTPTTTFANLHLDPYSNTTTFQIRAGGRVYDLKLDYSSRAQFVSEDCGEKFVVSGLKVSSLTFDSVRVASSTPKSRPVAGTNVEIFRCPNTSGIKLRFGATVTITNIQTDYATIVAPTGAVTNIVLPLNTSQSQSTINFTFSGGIERSLILNYERETDTRFNACGEQVSISKLVITNTNFSTAKVVRPTIQDINQPNLEISL